MNMSMPPPPYSSEPPTTGSGAAVSDGESPERTEVLDEASLDRLRELDPTGQNGLLERVFKAFDSSAVRLMGQLAEARLTNDLHVIRHVTHTLKSSSASIGALKLSRLCADIEGMVRLSNSVGLPERLAAMDAEVEVVLAAVRATQGVTR